MATFGIDLGTTTTLIARSWPGENREDVRSEVLAIKQPGYEDGREQNHLPSVAYFREGQDPVVGLWAKENGMRHPLRCARAVKRLMGQDWTLKEVDRTPAQVSALYLKEVLGQTMEVHRLDELTVTVPASYTTNQRRDTLKAIDLALQDLGQKPLKRQQREQILISEPVAALLAFVAWDTQKALHMRQLDIGKKPRVLVYDIGGGTLDLTLVELSWLEAHGSPALSNLQFNILSISRHNQFGGEDFDHRLAQEFLYPQLLARFPKLKELVLTDEQRLALRYDLVNEAERLKIELNQELLFGESEVQFRSRPLVIHGQEYVLSVQLGRQEYESLMKPFLAPSAAKSKNALSPITEMLQDMGIEKGDIQHLLPVGGMSELLPLQEALERYWGNPEGVLVFPVRMEAIVQGAAVYSHLKASAQGFTIEEPAADAYYVRLADGGFDLLLRRTRRQSERKRYTLDSRNDKLLLQIFAGADPPEASPLDAILHTMVYQGGTAVPLGRVCEKGQLVYIEMERRDGTKLPIVRVQMEGQSIHEIRFEQLEAEGH